MRGCGKGCREPAGHTFQVDVSWNSFPLVSTLHHRLPRIRGTSSSLTFHKDPYHSLAHPPPGACAAGLSESPFRGKTHKKSIFAPLLTPK